MHHPYTVPGNATDSYKVGHRPMYPKDMTRLLSNWTARGSRIPGVTKMGFFGLQAFLQKFFCEFMQTTFFDRPKDAACARHQRRVISLLGVKDFDISHWHALHDLGYVPLRFCAIPEGTEVPLRVPSFTVENTHPDFAWLVNYFESVMSAEDWLPSTTLTAAIRFRRMLNGWADKTSDTPEFVDFQGHDFSFRGHTGLDSASASGAGHLLAFAGSDSLSAMDWTDYFYSDDFTKVRDVGTSVPASEHSVMCAGGKSDELETISRLLDTFPEGIVSVVSDTWNLWDVITKILPQLKTKIMSRQPSAVAPGRLVIRPDSGDPVLIICGDGRLPPNDPACKGVIELLWDIFGGTVNSKGFKVLDSHIGAIYGDAITYERADEICRRLAAKGFASTNIVLGIGSFTYQYVTRDTLGMAMKATWCERGGIGYNLFKDPVTDNGVKKSAKGRLAVLKDTNGELYLVNEATPEQEAMSELRPVWEDGKFLKRWTYREIAERVGLRKLLPEA